MPIGSLHESGCVHGKVAMHVNRRDFTALALGGVMLSLDGGMAAAADSKGLDGSTIEWIIPFDAGGGTDVRSRFHFPWLKKYLKSHVNIIIENKPGAGGISGTNMFYANRTRRDQLNMLSTGGSTNIAMIMRQPAVKFNFLDMIPIAGFPVGAVWYVSRDTGIKTVEDLRHPSKTLHYAGVAASGRDLSGLLAFDLLGIEVQVTFGYTSGGASTLLAFERRESNFDTQTTSVYRTRLAGSPGVVPLYTDGILDEHGDVVRDPSWPDLPSVKDVYVTLHGKVPSGPEWEAYKIALGTRGALDMIVWLHSDAPEEVVDELTRAFRDMSHDPEYQKALAKQTGGYPIIVGQEVLKPLVKQTFDIDPSVREWLYGWLEQKYGISRTRK
jgi:tripartite-type tricarboxylate transporter receptor subunit TctC